MLTKNLLKEISLYKYGGLEKKNKKYLFLKKFMNF